MGGRNVHDVHHAGLQQALQSLHRATTELSAKCSTAIGTAPIHRLDRAKVILREGSNEDAGDFSWTNDAPPRLWGQWAACHAST